MIITNSEGVAIVVVFDAVLSIFPFITVRGYIGNLDDEQVTFEPVIITSRFYDGSDTIVRTV